jgi:uncharacterized protein involved in tellurium resistance
MKNKIIEAIISPDGKTIKVETSGYKGKSCMADTASLYKGLASAINTEKKAEYFSKEDATDVNIIGRS